MARMVVMRPLPDDSGCRDIDPGKSRPDDGISGDHAPGRSRVHVPVHGAADSVLREKGFRDAQTGHETKGFRDMIEGARNGRGMDSTLSLAR